MYGDRAYGFRSFVEASYGVGHALAERYAIGPGDRVAVLSQNNPEWCLAFWGTVAQGAILVGLNGWWKADEILYGLQDSGATVLVADRKRFERIADRLDEAPDLAHVFLIDADPADIAGVGGSAKLHRFDELTTTPAAAPPAAEIAEDDTAVIFYTSGTTGKPKGAMSTHRSMIANLQNTIYLTVAGAMASPSGDSVLGSSSSPTVSLLTSPLFHVSGCHSGLVVGLMAGIKIVIPEGRFDPLERPRADPGPQGHRVGHGPDHGVAGLRAPGPPRLRHLDASPRWRSAARRRPTSCSARWPRPSPTSAPPPTPTG